MSLLFSPGKIGTLEIPNRLMRSATAERMADEAVPEWHRPRQELIVCVLFNNLFT